MPDKIKLLPQCTKKVPGHTEPMICPIAIEAEENKSRYNRILKHSFEEIYIIDAKSLRFLEVSKGAIMNLGYTPEELKQMTPMDIKPSVSRATCTKVFNSLVTGNKDVAKLSTLHERKDGSTYDVDIRVQYAPGNEPVFIAMVTDVTERNVYEKELKALAFRDPGTDLYNRRYFLEHMEGTINHVNRMHSSIGLVLIDMDDFSKVNNKYGHLAGDKIICDFAEKINDVFSRKTDVVARYGGDEFVVMCIDNSEKTLLMKCNQLIKRLQKPSYYEGHEIVQTASIGICLRDGDNVIISSEDLIKGADIAMYQIKESGKNNVKVCDNNEIE